MAQCLDGYEADVVASKTAVYGSPGNNSTPFQVGTLTANQHICVNENVEGNYVKIRYGNKTGYIQLSSLRSRRTEAVSTCSSCGQTNDENDGPNFSVQRDAREIRRAIQPVATGLGEPLSYADEIMKNTHLGAQVAVLGSWCGRAVSRMLRGAGLLPGPVPSIYSSGGFAGKDAKSYLSQYGFRDDRSACNRPGVVLVFGGAVSVPKGARRTSGDTWGHAEILGTDGKYHHFISSSSRIDKIMGENRRPLIGCMVKGN